MNDLQEYLILFTFIQEYIKKKHLMWHKKKIYLQFNIVSSFKFGELLTFFSQKEIFWSNKYEVKFSSNGIFWHKMMINWYFIIPLYSNQTYSLFFICAKSGPIKFIKQLFNIKNRYFRSKFTKNVLIGRSTFSNRMRRTFSLIYKHARNNLMSFIYSRFHFLLSHPLND